MTEMASDEASAGNLARTNARRLWIHDPVRFVLHVAHYTFRTTRTALHIQRSANRQSRRGNVRTEHGQVPRPVQ